MTTTEPAPSLFDVDLRAHEPLARGSDPVGSWDARRAIKPHAKAATGDILRTLADLGPLRAAQIAGRMPWRNDGTVRTACSRLQRAGLLEVVEHRQVAPGRRESVYALSPKGREAITSQEPTHDDR